MDVPVVEVRLLGPVEISVGGVVAPVSGKPRLLLAVLAMFAGRPVTAEALAYRLWGEEPPRHVRGSLQTVVVRLRRAIGVDLIETLPAGYRLRLAADQVDLLRFRRLAAEAAEVAEPAEARRALGEALALWRGEPLAGIGSPALDRDDRPTLVEEWLAALERRVDLDLELGRQQELIVELRELTSRHPLRESLWSRLIGTLYRAGRSAEAIEAYHRLRGTLADRLGIDPSAELQRLYRTVLRGEGDGGDGGPPERPVEAAAAPPPVPRQLPADIIHFTGRAADLAALDELAGGAELAGGDASLVIVAVDGPAGIGKTSLAVHWAHRAGHRFPDGQLYLNLRGYGPGEPVGPAAALDVLLRALGTPPERIPDGVPARSAALRGALAGRRVLLLLDNARDAEQVRPLLPGSGGLVLVTSRNQLRGLAARDGARRLTLDALTSSDAGSLLVGSLGRERAGAEPDAAAELVGLCGGMPLALRITAERVNRFPGASLAELARDLRDERRRLDALSDDDPSVDLRAVFSWSYRLLRPPTARLFRLLGLHPGDDISLPAAAALADLPLDEARRELDRLLAGHLVEQRRPHRYELHDLLRAYAADESAATDAAADRDAALARLVDWYLRTADAAYQQLRPMAASEQELALPPAGPRLAVPELDSDLAALDWYDVELANLVAVAGSAARHAPPGTVVALHRRTRAYFQNRCHWDAWLETSRLALRDARATGDPTSVGFALDSIGVAHLHQRRYREALRYCEQGAAALERETGGRQWVQTLSNLGLAHLYLGELDEAADCFHRVLATEWAGQTPVLVNLGALYGMRGRFQEALDFSLRAAEAHERRGERANLVNALANVAEANLNLGRHDEALASCRRAIEECRAIGHRLPEAPNLVLLGRILRAAGELEEARDAQRQALALLEEIGDHGSEVVEEARRELRELREPAAPARAAGR